MMKYSFYVSTYQRESEGKGDTQPDVGIDRQTNIIGQTGRTPVIETTYLIGL